MTPERERPPGRNPAVVSSTLLGGVAEARVALGPTDFMTVMMRGTHSLCAGVGGSFRTVGFYEDVDEFLDAAVAECAAGRNVWFGVHPLIARPADGRGAASDVDGVHVLAADLD